MFHIIVNFAQATIIKDHSATLKSEPMLIHIYSNMNAVMVMVMITCLTSALGIYFLDFGWWVFVYLLFEWLILC